MDEGYLAAIAGLEACGSTKACENLYCAVTQTNELTCTGDQ